MTPFFMFIYWRTICCRWSEKNCNV